MPHNERPGDQEIQVSEPAASYILYMYIYIASRYIVYTASVCVCVCVCVCVLSAGV